MGVARYAVSGTLLGREGKARKDAKEKLETNRDEKAKWQTVACVRMNCSSSDLI
jgi:hypothetical protein